MIPANKSELFQRYFAGHVRRRFARRFSSVRVLGLPHLARSFAERPTVIVANHTSWWDSLVFFDLCRRTFGVDAHALMDAKNLRRLKFLGWIGAFGVELGDKEDGARAVEYGGGLLDRPGRVVVVFPQGRERPMTERPLRFLPGAAKIAHAAAAPVDIVPVALRYEHGRDERPDALVHIGRAMSVTKVVEATRAAMESAVTHLLDETQRAIHAGEIATWPIHIGGGGAPIDRRLLAAKEG